MIIDMGPILRGEVTRMNFEYTLDPIPMDRITFNDNAKVSGVITDEGGYMRLIAEAHLAYASLCDRCLEPTSHVFVLEFERTVAAEGTLTEEQIEDNVDEFVIIEKGKLDIDEQLTEALLLDFPRKILCSEDCPGMCFKCGKLLKYGACGCNTKEIDPRLAVLANLKLDEE
jgi:uncharacterized protein